MNSGKSKRLKLKLKRLERKAALKEAERLAALQNPALLAGLKRGTIIPVDPSKVVSKSSIPSIPQYYVDEWFTCKDCGKEELWTAKQQQRWYEVQGGVIESIAIRCHDCRRKEKQRREAARKSHLEGITKKRKPPA